MVPSSNLGAGERNVLILCLVVREMGSSYLMFDPDHHSLVSHCPSFLGMEPSSILMNIMWIFLEEDEPYHNRLKTKHYQKGIIPSHPPSSPKPNTQ